MSNNKIVFSSVKTTSKVTADELEVDSDGYYTLNLGALNAFNSAGAYYALAGSKDLFESNAVLMRRIKNGYLRSEVGHPKKLPGMTFADYVNRITTIDLNNVCAHIKEVWLENGKGDTVITKGKIKPLGPKANVLESILKEKEANVAFSVRSLTKDTVQNGIVVKTMTNIVTWDFILEGGMEDASKWKTLGIESIELLSIDLEDKETINEVIDGLKSVKNIGNEDNVEMLDIVKNLLDCSKNNSCIIHDW